MARLRTSPQKPTNSMGEISGSGRSCWSRQLAKLRFIHPNASTWIKFGHVGKNFPYLTTFRGWPTNRRVWHRYSLPRLISSRFVYTFVEGPCSESLGSFVTQVCTYLYWLPSGKLTWQWKTTIFNRRYIFKWWISHCYVSLPECSRNSEAPSVGQFLGAFCLDPHASYNTKHGHQDLLGILV